MTNKHKPLSLGMATSLVTGNMIGSGIFLLPASLAAYGSISIGGWLLSAIGALSLAFVFASLARRIRGSGGPYLYAREGFGDIPGFMVGWGYWISAISANAAIAVALVSYLSVFFPLLAINGVIPTLTTLGLVWLLTLANLRGVRTGGQIQLVTTIGKITPLLIIAIAGLVLLEPAHFTPLNRSTESDGSALISTAILTMWAFLGMESANIPAADVKNPQRNVPRAAVFGTLIASLIYIPASIAVMGLLPPEQLVQSAAPFADAAASLWGDWGYYLVAVGAIISCFGALNGWTLCAAQLPAAIAQNDQLSPLMNRRNRHQVPVYSMIISSVVVSLLVLLNVDASLAEQFTFVILLSTLTAVLPYLTCSLTQLLYYLRMPKQQAPNPLNVVITLCAIAFSVGLIVSVDWSTLAWGSTLIAAGLPFYFWHRYRVKIRQLATEVS